MNTKKIIFYGGALYLALYLYRHQAEKNTGNTLTAN